MTNKVFSKTKIVVIAAASLAFVIFAAATYVDTHSDAIWNKYRLLVENKLSKYAGVSVSIGSAEGGIFRSLILKDINVSQKTQEGVLLPIFDIKYVGVNTRLWDLVFNKEKEIRTIRLVSPKIFLRPVEKNPVPGSDRTMGGLFLTKAKTKALREKPLKVLIEDGQVYAGAKQPLIESFRGAVRYDGKKINFDMMEGCFLGSPFEVEGIVYDIDKEPQMMLYADFKGKKIAGGIAVWDLIQNPCVGGKVDLFGKVLLNFGGKIDVKKGELIVDDVYIGEKRPREKYCEVTDAPQIRLSYKLEEKNQAVTDLSLKHLDMWGTDLHSHLEIRSKHDQERRSTTFDISSSGTMIDLRPFFELNGSIRMDEDAFEITNLNLGESFKVNGIISRSVPQLIDLKIAINQTSLDRLISMIYGIKKPFVSGIVSGEITIKGNMPCPKIKGRLEASEGHLGDLAFTSGSINIEGYGNRLLISDSRINTKDTWYRFEGGFDAENIKHNPLSGLRLVAEDGTVVWEGWKSNAGKTKLSLGGSDDVTFGFKRYMNDSPVLGVEHKQKF